MTTAVSVRNARHLSSLRQLRCHISARGKRQAYRRLLRRYGVDLATFEGLVEHPRLVYAEQPGCWFYAEDVLRARLLQRLMDTGEFASSSGVLSLCLDAFSDRGVKRLFSTFRLSADVSTVHLLGASYRRRHRHRTYSALALEPGPMKRLATVFTSAADMLEAARLSPETFANEMVLRFQEGFEPGLRPLMPPAGDRASLRLFARRLRNHHLDDALGHLATVCCELRPGLGWAELWNSINERLFGLPIDALGPLYNRFLLSVNDPVRMGRALSEDLRTICEIDDRRDVSVAATVTSAKKYRMVFFEKETERFYFCDGDQARHALDWQALRRQAFLGRAGGPSGVIAYLMMAAAGIYLVSDPVDGSSPFESAARRIHRHHTGLRFPSLAPAPRLGSGRGGFLKIFSDDFEQCCTRTLDRFVS